MYETDGRKEKLQYIQHGGKVLVPYHHHTTLGDVGPSTTTNTNITVGHGAEFSIHLSCSNLFIHLKLGQGEV